MTKQKLICSVALTSMLFTVGALTPAMAKMSINDEKCNVTLNYDVTVEPKKLQISDNGSEKYRVELDQLYVDGKKVTLTAKQQTLLTQYSDELSRQVPEVIYLVGDVVVIASQAVNMALTPIFGDATGSQIDKLMTGIQTRIDTMAYQQGDKFYLGSTDSSIEHAFNEEFEQEIEQMVTNSMGSLMMTLGSQIMSSEGGSFEEKMNTFSQKMDNVGKDIEQQLESQSQGLEQRADKICDNFEGLLVLESQVRKSIPELAPYTLAKLGELKE
ncbi:YggN family protein [Shewanella sp. AC91-MNA-CIBAN-0169]|uniref:YggN family protein n=1 Tax=Shewanella sp. AC91-MNA-CIBAN-0169 TaxID=3140466 RepID=UPI003323CE37